MKFKTLDDLKVYTEKWLNASEIELLWKWLHNGMISEEKVIEITQRCCCEEECMTNTMKLNAWEEFFKTYNKK